jgi:hypothetical protein
MTALRVVGVVGVDPRSIAEHGNNKVNPDWRVDCAAKLNWFVVLPGTAVIARIAPILGSTETIAAAGSSRGQSCESLFAARWSLGSTCRPAARHAVCAVHALELVDHARKAAGSAWRCAPDLSGDARARRPRY